MTRIESGFRALRRDGRKGFIPYITAGDPSIETTEQIILELERSGADIIELGVPFSDPMADGPVIQRASERALANQVSVRDCLDLVRRVRRQSEIPIVLFSYVNPLLSIGLGRIGDELKSAGVGDSKVPKVAKPLEELTSMNFTPNEGFLLSRINGTWDIGSLVKISPIREPDALLIFYKLWKDGIIALD